jgi:rare lipoprotein A
VTRNSLFLPFLPALTLALVLGGCGGPAHKDGAPEGLPDYSNAPDAVPRFEKVSRAKQRPYTVLGRTYQPLKSSQGYVEQGVASWYGTKFHGRQTALGERYDMYSMSAAHKLLPLPTYVQVRNLENGRSAVVRVNDRGPFHDNRIIDLSYAAASKLGMLGKGTALVEVRAIDPSAPKASGQLASAASGGTPAGNPRIYIQVGAFGDPGNARRLQQRLQQHLSRSVLIEDGGHVHRVQVGPLASVESADLVIAQLREIDIHETRMLLR